MTNTFQLFDVVALTTDLTAYKLRRGQVGTIVEHLAPDVFEVDFSDDDGQSYAEISVRADQMILLHYRPVTAEDGARANWPPPSIAEQQHLTRAIVNTPRDLPEQRLQSVYDFARFLASQMEPNDANGTTHNVQSETHLTH